MKAEWQLWATDDSRLAPQTCAQIVSFALALPAMRAEVGGKGYDPEKRRSDVRWIRYQDEEFRPIWQILQRRIETANRNAFGVDVTYIDSLQFTSYDSSDEGYFDWHMDTFFSEHERQRSHCLHRKLTCILQLSAPDTYDGGNLELEASPPPDSAELKKQGSMIVFPSFVRHRLTPVTTGVRHSLVTWMEGPQWR